MTPPFEALLLTRPEAVLKLTITTEGLAILANVATNPPAVFAKWVVKTYITDWHVGLYTQLFIAIDYSSIKYDEQLLLDLASAMYTARVRYLKWREPHCRIGDIGIVQSGGTDAE